MRRLICPFVVRMQQSNNNNTSRQIHLKMCGSKGAGGGGWGSALTEKSQKFGFLSNTGPDRLKITKLPSQLSM